MNPHQTKSTCFNSLFLSQKKRPHLTLSVGMWINFTWNTLSKIIFWNIKYDRRLIRNCITYTQIYNGNSKERLPLWSLYNLKNDSVVPEELWHIYKHDIWQITSKCMEVNIACIKYKYSAYIKKLHHQINCFQPFWCCRQYKHISITLTSNGGIKSLVKFDFVASVVTNGSSLVSNLWHPWFQRCHSRDVLRFSLVEIVAVAATGTIMTLRKLPDATTRFRHHLLRHCHHDAKVVRILKCLKDIIRGIF